MAALQTGVSLPHFHGIVAGSGAFMAVFTCIATLGLFWCFHKGGHMYCYLMGNGHGVIEFTDLLWQCSQRWRETNEEKRALQRSEHDMINEVRQAAEVHRQVLAAPPAPPAALIPRRRRQNSKVFQL